MERERGAMKKRVSVKLFFTVLWRGISQVLSAIGKFLGMKDGEAYTRVVWHLARGVIATFVLIFSSIVLWMFMNEVVYRGWIRPYTSDKVSDCKNVSNRIVFQRMYYNYPNGRLYDRVKKKVVLKDVDWVYKSADNDSLAVFAQNGRRGYFDRFTGEVVIPAVYTRAWVFSEGLAAVEKDGKLLFINHSGQVVIDNGFEVMGKEPVYAFKKGYCMIQNPVDGKCGLIDRKGKWVLLPEYDNIEEFEGLWKVEKEGLYGLFSESMDTLFSADKVNIYLVNEGVVEVRYDNHTAKRFDHEGNLLVDFVIDEVLQMYYDTAELYSYESDGVYAESSKSAVADCQKYMVRCGYVEYYGLMGRDGKRITPPDYESIEAIAKDLYLCQPQGIIIDNQGKRVE